MADTTVGIIGAGQMGSGIAHVFALSGYRVLLNDVAQDRIEAGIATISGNLNRQLASGRIDESARDAALERIVARRQPQHHGRHRACHRSGQRKRRD